jgi:hypothetical protein
MVHHPFVFTAAALGASLAAVGVAVLVRRIPRRTRLRDTAGLRSA